MTRSTVSATMRWCQRRRGDDLDDSKASSTRDHFAASLTGPLTGVGISIRPREDRLRAFLENSKSLSERKRPFPGLRVRSSSIGPRWPVKARVRAPRIIDKTPVNPSFLGSDIPGPLRPESVPSSHLGGPKTVISTMFRVHIGVVTVQSDLCGAATNA